LIWIVKCPFIIFLFLAKFKKIFFGKSFTIKNLIILASIYHKMKEIAQDLTFWETFLELINQKEKQQVNLQLKMDINNV